MAIRHVVTEGDPILRKHCREITEVTDRIRTTMEDMLETMRAEMGVGIAGPQVGVMRRMFVAEPEPGRVYFMINPQITEEEGSQIGEEGCLSVPGLVGTVERPQKIKIKALDLDGKPQEYIFEDFDARVMCHEYDHLEGILYTDIATDVHDPLEDVEVDD
jgi:peptide deformylase